MKTKSRIARSIPQDESPLRHLPLVDLLVDTRTELFELAMRSGLKVFTAMLEEDRTAVCGPRYAHEPDRSASRAGTVRSEVVLGGRKVAIQRPRVRTADGEVALPTFQTMAHRDPLDRRVAEQMLVGVATRQYARSLEPITAEIESRGTSKSAVSRRFVAKTRAQLETWQAAPLDGLDLVALLLDGVHVGEHWSSHRRRKRTSRHPMANQAQPPDPTDSNGQNDIDEVLGRANPNPERTGCPPHDVLIALAGRERPIGDPAYEHLVKCSPCYREFRALQQGGVSHAHVGGARLRWIAAAAVLLILVSGAWFLLSRPQDGGRPAAVAEQASAADLRAELDLRKYSVTRSEQPQSAPPPLSLQRGRLNATILLPVGSEPGAYEVQVLDSELLSKATASGEAGIENHATTLKATLDLRALPPGTYRLALRRQGEEWQMFPATLK